MRFPLFFLFFVCFVACLAFPPIDRQVIDHSWATHFIPSRAWDSFAKTNPGMRNDIVVSRSQKKSWHAHEIWHYFQEFSNQLQLLCGWVSPADNSSLVLFNLKEKTLQIKWASNSSSNFVAYSDGSWKKGDVLWTRRNATRFGVGRVLFTIRLKGLQRLTDLDGDVLQVSPSFSFDCTHGQSY